jgi:hypothetical protein
MEESLFQKTKLCWVVLSKVLKKHTNQLITNSNNYKLRNRIQSAKNKFDKSGIYVRFHAVLEGAITVILDSHAER